MSSPSTVTLTPRIRITRQVPSHYDRSSASQIASSSKANFSKLPDFSQLMDVDIDVDIEGTNAFSENDTASEKSTATTTKTPLPQSNPAATLRALLAKLPTTSSTPTQPLSKRPPEREPDYDLSVATRGAPSVQESVRSIFSKALGDSEDTPTRPLQRQDSFDDRENEATPMPGRARGAHGSLKGSDSGNSSEQQSRGSAKFKGSSTPITQEFMRERFKEAEMSDTEFLPSPMSARGFSMKSPPILDDLGSSQVPIATSTPQHSLSLSVGSHFQSNLLDNNTEMRYALDYNDSQDDLFSDVDIPDEKPQSRFATDISNTSHNRSSPEEATGNSPSWRHSPSIASTHKVHDISTPHPKRNLFLTSSPSTSHRSEISSHYAGRQANAEISLGRASAISHDSRRAATDATPEISTANHTNEFPEQSASGSMNSSWKPSRRSTRTPSPLPATSAAEPTLNDTQPSNASHTSRPNTERSPSPFKAFASEERSTISKRPTNFSTTPHASHALKEDPQLESRSTPAPKECHHNDSSAWTASMSMDNWQQSPYQPSSPRFPQKILQEEEDQRFAVDEDQDETVPTTPLKTPQHSFASNSRRHEPEISSPSPSKVPALPSPESSPQSESRAPWAYNRARHPMTPGFATPKPPGGWLATPKQPRYRELDDGVTNEEVDSVSQQLEQPTLTKTPRPPGGWVTTPMPNPVPFARSNDLGVDKSDIHPRDAGLLTPIPSLSKIPALDFKTPAPPGAWAQAPARKSILKVRFDADSPNNPLGEGPSRRRSKQLDGDVSNAHSSPSRIKPKSPKIRVLDAFGREADDDDDDSKAEVPETNRSKIRVVDEMGEEVKTQPEILNESSVSRPTSLMQLRQGLNELMEEIDDFDDDLDVSVDHSRVEALKETSAAARQNAIQIQSNMKTGLKYNMFWKNRTTTWWYWPLVCVGQIIFGALIFFFCIRLTRTMFLENYWEPFNPELHLQAFGRHNFLLANRTVWFSSRTLEWLDWSNYLAKPKHYLWHLWEFAGQQRADKIWPLT